ncbi:MAG TPA: glycosyltransferase family 39 protein [Blastocatellia bacterium]
MFARLQPTPSTENEGGQTAASDEKQNNKIASLRNGIDWLPFAITVAAGAICYGLFFRRGIWLSVVGYSDVGAERLLLGEIPYRDFPYDYTPGLLWLNAFLMKCLGTALLPIRIGLLAFKLATLLALYELGKRLLNRWLALVPVFMTLGWLGYKHIFVTHPAQYSMLFVLIAGTLLIKFDQSARIRWVVAAGAAIGVAFVFKYNVGVTLISCGTLALLARPYMWHRDATISGHSGTSKVVVPVAAWWTGFLIIVALMAVYLAFNHALVPMLDHFYHSGSEHVADEAVAGFGPARLLVPGLLAFAGTCAIGLLLALKARRLFGYYCVMLLCAAALILVVPGPGAGLRQSADAAVPFFAPLVFLVAAAALIVCIFRRQWSGSLELEVAARDRAIMLVGFLALGAYLEVYPRGDEYHVVRALPAAFLLFVALAARMSDSLLNRLKHGGAWRRSHAVYLWAIPAVIIALAGVNDTWRPQFEPNWQFLDRFPVAIGRAKGILVTESQKQTIEELASIIYNNSSQGDTVFSFSHRGGAFNFLCDRRNPTRLLWWETTGIKDLDRQRVLAGLEAQEPKLVLIQSDLKSRARAARAILEKRYHMIGTVEDIDVYSRGLSTEGVP